MEINVKGVHNGPVRIGVVGLGYVGLPVALGFAKNFKVVAYDVDSKRIKQLKQNSDKNKEFNAGQLIARSKNIRYTDFCYDLADCNFYIITVPTPIDEYNVPDLSYLISATSIVGHVLDEQNTIVYESTVYPGCTRQIAKDYLSDTCPYWLGYSPERINPGDHEHTFENITKIVSGCTDASRDFIAQVYSQAVETVYPVDSIEIAESAKVIENIQRDVNIGLMNELSMLFDKMGIPTNKVLDAACSKWNFHDYRPGLVGGHCIGVDPYYLLHAAKKYNFHPQIIDAGRRINDGMVDVIVNKIRNFDYGGHVLIAGYTFKENCNDTRNSKALEIYDKLIDAKVSVLLYDPFERDLDTNIDEIKNKANHYNVLVLAVPHDEIKENLDILLDSLQIGGLIIDVKSILDPFDYGDYEVWQL
jgi:UDP-N-acetyl-D-galactosamine dehydrogenase